jgi:hypothetical protein
VDLEPTKAPIDASPADGSPVAGIATTIATSTPAETVLDGPSREGSLVPVGSAHTANTTTGADLFDNDAATRWQTIDPNPTIAVIVIDLGAVSPVGSLAWLPMVDGAADGLLVEISTDGDTWTLVDTSGTAVAGTWQSTPVDASARHIRLVIRSDGSRPLLGGIAELVIFPPR